jgi:16S rRNA (cytidine1402-2'-O)-methyltransferase
VARDIEVVPIPGASALIAALSGSGLPTSRFHFLGFLPRQDKARSAMLEEVAPLTATLALYESPRRLGETLKDLQEALGDRRACVARELTKVHEEWARGSLSELAKRFGGEPPLGEVVVIVEGRRGDQRWSVEEVDAAVRSGLARGEALKPLSKEIAGRAGWTAQEVYRLGISQKAKS